MASHRPVNRVVLSSDDEETESVDLSETSSPVQGGSRNVVRGFASLAPRQQFPENTVARSQSQAFASNNMQQPMKPTISRSQSFPTGKSYYFDF